VFTGKEKLNVPPGEPVRLLLESDGTQVEDGEYFRTLPNNTVLLLLRPGERWFPAGVDVIRAGEHLYTPIMYNLNYFKLTFNIFFIIVLFN
jgi:hypothetical protein